MPKWIKPPKGTALTTHFSIEEAVCRHCGKVPDIEEVKRTAMWMENVRAILGHPLQVLSWCRCPIHNAAIGGAEHSYHLKGWAVDITCKGLSPIQVRQILAPHHGEGKLIGGMGSYPGFTHVDRGPFRSWAE